MVYILNYISFTIAGAASCKPRRILSIKHLFPEIPPATKSQGPRHVKRAAPYTKILNSMAHPRRFSFNDWRILAEVVDQDGGDFSQVWEAFLFVKNAGFQPCSIHIFSGAKMLVCIIFGRVFRPRTESNINDRFGIIFSNQPVNCWIIISLSSRSWSPSNKNPHVSLYAPRFTGASVEPKLEKIWLEKLRIFGPPCPPPQPKKNRSVGQTCTQGKNKKTSSSVNPKNVQRGFSRDPWPTLCHFQVAVAMNLFVFRAVAPKQDSSGGMAPTSPFKYWLFNDGMLIFHISPIWLGRIPSPKKIA